MDSAVLVSMPQVWGVNVSYASPQSTQRTSNSSWRHDSRASSTATDQQAHSNRGNTHMADINRQDHVSINVASSQGTAATSAAASTTRSSSGSRVINRSSSAQVTASVPWLCPEDDAVYEPYVRLQYETIDAAVAVRRVSHRDQQQTHRTTPQVAAVSRYAATYPLRSSSGIPTPPPAVTNRLRSTRSSSSSGTSSSSSSPARLTRLHRHSSSAGAFFSATANQLMSAFSGFSLRSNNSSSSLSSRAASSSSSRRTRRARQPSSSSHHHVRDAQQLPRTPAALESAAAALPSDSYDDLLALDQFNVKRALRPTVLEQLPRRIPNAEDQKLQRMCFICLEVWQQQQQCVDTAAAAADSRSCQCCCSTKHADNIGQGAAEPAAAAVGDEPFIPEWIRAAMRRAQYEQQQQSDRPTTAAAVLEAICNSCNEDSSSTDGSQETSTSNSSSRSSSPPQQQQQQQSLSPPVVSIKQLPCGHEFCCGCISTWLQDHATCPVCRWTFPEEQTHLINMGK